MTHCLQIFLISLFQYQFLHIKKKKNQKTKKPKKQHPVLAAIFSPEVGNPQKQISQSGYQ